MITSRMLIRSALPALLLLAAGCGSRNPDELMERGLQDYAAGHSRAAARSFERAVRFAPDDAEIRLWSGIALWKAGKAGQALPYFQQAAEMDANNPLPLEYEAAVHAAQANWVEAYKRLNQARARQTSPRILNAMGVAWVRMGNPVAARAQFDEAVRLNRRYAPALYNLGVLTRGQGRLDDARQFFLHYLQMAPDGDKADAARKALEALGPAQPARGGGRPPRVSAHVNDLMKQALAAQARRAFDEAALRFNEAAEADSGSPEPLWGLARMYDGLPGQGEKAADAYRAFLQSFSDDTRATEARARLNALAGRRRIPATPPAPPPGALADSELAFRKAEVRDRAEAMAALQRGAAYYAKNDLNRALFDFRRAIELDDTLPEGYFNLGLVYWKRQDNEHARQLFQAAVSRRPDWSDARCMLARIYFQQKLGIKAVEHLHEILKADPAFADAYYELGRYYSASPSHRPQVRDWYGHYLKLAPAGDHAPETRAWLAANP